MDLVPVISVCTAVFGILIPMAGMFLWSRTEANADRRDMNQKIEANMKETREMMKDMGEKMQAQITAIQLEIKDFHARLCVIESTKHNHNSKPNLF